MNQMELNKIIELAWAAGFYDGEGSSGSYMNNNPGKGPDSVYFQLSVSQKDPDLLTRFNNAVGKYRTINGPNTFGVYSLKFSGEEALEVFNLIVPYLSQPKKIQAQEAIQKWQVRPLSKPSGTREQFPCGHPRSGNNVTKYHKCRACANRRDRERYQRIKNVSTMSMQEPK